MSVLVVVNKDPRLVDGAMVQVGELCRLPDALALALIDRGRAVVAGGKAHLKAAEVVFAKRDAVKAKKAAKRKAEGAKR